MLVTINMQKTGFNIRRLMDENGMTVKDLQNELGFGHPFAIYKWLNGKNLPALDNLVILAKLFKTPMDAIIITDDRRAV